jgi:uncharacterized paraquat-inducible protein A
MAQSNLSFLAMPLQEQLIELSAKHLIACRECHTNADVRLVDSLVTMTCPGCHTTLGNWETTPAALEDITAYMARGEAKNAL